MAADPPDAALVDRALAGSQAAYGELVRRYQGPIFNLVVQMVRRRPEAEDLTQEVFLKAFKALHRYDRTRRFSSWFFKIAHNHALDYLRKTQQPTLSIDADTSTDALVSEGPSPAELTEQAKLAGALRAAIGGLRVQYREAIVLRYQEDLPLEEIADVMGIPEGTVKTYLHRARQELAGEMTRRGWARD